MPPILNAAPALALLALGIVLILTGQPSASVIILDAAPGPWLVCCGPDTVAAEADSVALVVADCDELGGAWAVAGEGISAGGGCTVDWRD